MSDKDFRQRPKPRYGIYALIAFVLALAVAVRGTTERDEEDDVYILMFDENGDVRTDDLKRAAYYAGFQ